ncbi:MAG: hypothetical protein LBB60_07430 [Desulfovibrio sp.]|jgi:hypothetical protein|nr:hypothetical protein [Desulfovibrio sp.]
MRRAGGSVCLFLFFFLWQNAALAATTGEMATYSEKAVDREQDDASFWKRFKVSGWLEGIHSMRIRAPHDPVTSRLRLRLELAADMGWLYGFASADAEKNWEIDSETGVEPHELWLEHVDTRWDIRVGRQIIIWGKADGVQVTDNISPPDYTESMTRDLDEIRQPVEAAKLRLLGEVVNLELIWIPVFRKAKLPEKDNPWAVSSQPPPGVRMYSDDAREPSPSLENSEAAVKLSGYFSGMDVAASAFYTWDDMPARRRAVSRASGVPEVRLRPEHHRMTIYGLEFSRPWSDFVFRGEAAYFVGRYRETTALDRNPPPKDSLKWLLGVDWTPGDDWTISAQILNEKIFGYQRCLGAEENDSLATVNISKKLFNQMLTVSNMLYYDLNDGEFFNRGKVEYEIANGFFASAGVDIFSGKNGQFGMYENNSQIWFKLKYSF